MNVPMGWRILAAAALLIVVTAACILVLVAQHQERIDNRLRFAFGQRVEPEKTNKRRLDDLLGAIRRLGTTILESGLLSRKAIADLEQTLSAAGHHHASAISLVIGSKVALMLVLPILAWFIGGNLFPASNPVVAMMVGASAGMFLPDVVIGRLRSKYLKDVESGLADALDLMVICADAGLPLETAIERVAFEFRDSDPATANELALTSAEMKMRPDRRQVLADLGTRTGLESLTVLGGTLAQTLQYGTPLAQALRVLSATMRQTMLSRFEERAARLPVLLTLPMMLFFLPCVILVAGGPAAVQVLHMMSN